MLWGGNCWVLGCVSAYIFPEGLCSLPLYQFCESCSFFLTLKINRLYKSAHTHYLLELVAKVQWFGVGEMTGKSTGWDLSLIPSTHMMAQSFNSSSSTSDAIFWPLLSLGTHAGKTLIHIKTKQKQTERMKYFSHFTMTEESGWSTGDLISSSGE